MAVIIGMSGLMKGRKLELSGDETTLGRNVGNAIRVDDNSVSGHHCVIRRQEQRYTLFDLNSTNGTRLNGQMTEQGRLKPKDIIQVGNIELMIDGQDIEIEPAEETVQEELEETSGVSNQPLETLGSPTTFLPRTDTRWQWAVAFGGVGAAVLVSAILFFVRLFGGT